MFAINEDKSIFITRGDAALFSVTVNADGEPYQFTAGETIRFKVFEKKDCQCVVLQKDFTAEDESESVTVVLNSSDTKLGEIISKPKDYWYEIELNPDSNPQTIIGYDEDGAKVFRLFPEGKDIEQ